MPNWIAAKKAVSRETSSIVKPFHERHLSATALFQSLDAIEQYLYTACQCEQAYKENGQVPKNQGLVGLTQSRDDAFPEIHEYKNGAN